MNYPGAGTVEYLYVEEEDAFYFIEMNTRVQVEHTISEEITGVDIVREQLEVAFNQRLTITQADIKINGFALECRINAEDSSNNFMPSPGPVKQLHLSLGRNVRVDTHIFTGYNVPPNYDSMIAKIIVHHDSREAAIKKMTQVLDETVIAPLKTNLDFQSFLMRHENYLNNNVDIKFLVNNKIIDQ